VVKVSPERAIIISGQTFFPICVWQQPRHLFDYHKYLGVNTILCPPQGENKKWYMDAAWEKGLYVFAPYSDEFKNHPAIIGWMILSNKGPEEIKVRCEEMKKIDPHRLTYVHLAWDEIMNFKPEQRGYYGTFFEKADVTCCHVFPMGKNQPDKLDAVGEVVDFMNKYSNNKIVPMIDLECGKLEKGDRKGIAPSKNHVRCEIWEAIVHGAKGLCYFTISFEPFVWSQIPAQNEDVLKYNNRLIQNLKDVILLGKDDVKIDKSAEEGLKFDVMAKRTDKELFIFAVNTADKEGNIKISIDKQFVMKEAVNYEKMEEKIELKENTIEEKFDKYQVKIYKLQLK
jgi:hypothetical protein